MKRVVYQGIPGSFSHLAAVKLFGSEAAIGRASFDEAFAAVEKGEADLRAFGDPTKGAIAHKSAAPLYHLEILIEGVEDHAENFTRFLLLSREAGSGNKTSLLLTLKHEAGSLAALLAIFADRKAGLKTLPNPKF